MRNVPVLDIRTGVKKMEKGTTIYLPDQVKADLDKLKVHPREPYHEVIERLMKKKKC